MRIADKLWTDATRASRWRIVGRPTRHPRRLLALMLGAGLAACLPTLAPQVALAAEPCPNEQLRSESRINPVTSEPYSATLPECRAYEMVTPLEKQGHEALSAIGGYLNLVSPDGSAIEWASEGDYAGAQNYFVGVVPDNSYVARRTMSGWITESAFPPATVIELPADAANAAGAFSPELSTETACGDRAQGTSLRCAVRTAQSGSWNDTPEYAALTGVFSGEELVGAARDGEVDVLKAPAGQHLLPADTSQPCGVDNCGAIYMVSAIGTTMPVLSLVDVNDDGEMIGPKSEATIGALPREIPYGGSYQAVSANGERVFFTATPEGGVPTLYARINGTETVAISNPTPSECTTCTATLSEGRFQGASANGERVFFTTSQQLLNSDTDTTEDLYEYDFAKPSGHELTQVSAGGLGDTTPGTGAEVQGVVNVSEDGSHIYYVARGVLTTLPNALGQVAEPGADNLYAYDTESRETRFVVTLSENDKQLWGVPVQSGKSGVFDAHTAQSTPDGRYLAFDSFASVITTGAEATIDGAQQVYRYDFDTGDIVRVSVGHSGYAKNGNVAGRDAMIAPLSVSTAGAMPTVNDENRAVTEDGTSVAFVTAAPLQNTDTENGAAESCVEGSNLAQGAGCEVYLWHECAGSKCADGNAGEVNLISEGSNPQGVIYAGMSAAGSDIFFQTRTQLVGQDTDELGDIYDARVDGGFPAPAPEPSCSGEECQGQPTAGPTFTTPNSITTAPSGNVSFATAESRAMVKITGHTSNSVSVSAPAAGSLALSGAGLVGAQKAAAKAGAYTLAVTLTKTERRLLAKRGRVTLTVTVRFTPTSGTPSTATTKLTMRSQPKKESKSKSKKK